MPPITVDGRAWTPGCSTIELARSQGPILLGANLLGRNIVSDQPFLETRKEY
jgi:hypothetical protein